MKKLLTLLVTTAAFSLLPSISQAFCVTTGAIPGVFVQAVGVTNIGVRTSRPTATFFNFTTTNPNIINAALNAEASHITVTVTGDAAVCGPIINGFSSGGNVVNRDYSIFAGFYYGLRGACIV
ncbi:MAG: hypothetical protein EXR78_03915 [Deltaproteobacteria bacterium]|nr:hypothetical protein [Deltaproteobacteria bacterium]